MVLINFMRGVAGALLMTLLLAVARARGLVSINIEQGLADVLSKSQDPRLWWAGLGWHLFNGGVLGVALGWILKKLNILNFRGGATIGFAYWFLASMAIGTFPVLDVLCPAGVPSAGPFGAFHGQTTFAVLLAVHLAYGLALVAGPKSLPS